MPDIVEQPEAIIELTRRDLEDIIETAAQRGARAALREVGLDDPKAVDDVKELRTLLSIWRDARTTAVQTFVQVAVTALLGLLAGVAAIKFGVFRPPTP